MTLPNDQDMTKARQSAQSSRFVDDPFPEDPLIGARLRYALTHVEQRILEALASAGFSDIQVAHFKVLRFPPPENERPIDLAQRAGTTKQAMNYLLFQLEELGYLRRHYAAGSAARLVSLTDKGWEVARVQRAAVRGLERAWEQRIGKQRFEVFRSVLKDLVGE